MNDLTTKDLLKLLAPFLAMTALGAVMLMLLMLHFLPRAASGGHSVVTFDVVKYTNAQRAIASSFMKPSADVSRNNELLLNLSERTRQAITDVAGPGTLVVLKQSVVQGQQDDITDDVLRKLSLPTNVPTSDGAAYAIEVAPTMLLQSQGEARPTTGAPSSGAQVLP